MPKFATTPNRANGSTNVGNVVLSADIAQQVIDEAARQDRTVASLVRVAVRHYLECPQKETP